MFLKKLALAYKKKTWLHILSAVVLFVFNAETLIVYCYKIFKKNMLPFRCTNNCIFKSYLDVKFVVKILLSTSLQNTCLSNLFEISIE